MSKKESGFTLLEVVVVLTVLGILTTVMANALKQNNTQLNRAAQEFQVALQHSRLEAIKRNRPIQMELLNGTFRGCVVPGDCKTFWQQSTYAPTITGVQNTLTGGLVWNPDGLPRDRNGSPTSGQFTLQAQHGQVVLTLSSAGVVRK